jgi:hypothetical protein
MQFKKTVLIIATITFLIMLLMMALVIKSSYENKKYPAVVSKCPDFWEPSEDKLLCNPPSDNTNNPNSITTPINALINDTNMERIKACERATDNNIVWDGITGRNLC